MVVSQSAATTRAFADQGGYEVDVGRDLLGTGAGSLKRAGTYLYHGETVFFDFSHEDNVLVIDLVPNASRYRHLFVAVDPPDTPAAAAERINAAVPPTAPAA